MTSPLVTAKYTALEKAVYFYKYKLGVEKLKCPDCGYEIIDKYCKNCAKNHPIMKSKSVNPGTIERLSSYDNLQYRTYTSKAEIDKALHTLEGIIKGIAIDNNVNITEVTEVIHWYEHYKPLANKHPFSELIPLLGDAITDKYLDNEEIKDIIWFCKNFRTDSNYYDMASSDIQRLHGILHGILSDNVITEDEVIGLKVWLDDNEHLASIYPYDEVYSLTLSVLTDGIVDDKEKTLLQAFFANFVDLHNTETINTAALSEIKTSICNGGICMTDPQISIEDKQFCFTGKSSKIQRKEFANVISALGGTYIDSVSTNTDYLVIGNEGNPCWAYACYGRKVESAVTLRKKGHRILIIHEVDFWDKYNDYISAL